MVGRREGHQTLVFGFLPCPGGFISEPVEQVGVNQVVLASFVNSSR